MGIRTLYNPASLVDMPSPTSSLTIRPLSSADVPKIREVHVGQVFRSEPDTTVKVMMQDMEDMYAARFGRHNHIILYLEVIDGNIIIQCAATRKVA
jgi:phenylalanyl-tRNA synthetase alpha subunit